MRIVRIVSGTSGHYLLCYPRNGMHAYTRHTYKDVIEEERTRMTHATIVSTCISVMHAFKAERLCGQGGCIQKNGMEQRKDQVSMESDCSAPRRPRIDI